MLAVDDDQRVRDSLTALLEGDHDVLTAGSGRHALDVLRRRDVDLVVLNSTLPDIDGEELLRQIKAVHPATPVIILTVVDRGRSARDTRAYAYFTKPFSQGALLACIREALQKAAKAAPTVEPGRSAEPGAWRRRRRLLLVDRDIGRRAALGVALQRAFVVDVAAPGPEAVDRLGTYWPDLVVYDAELPAGEFSALLTSLRARQPLCPVIVTSASEEADVLRVLAPHTVESLVGHPVYLDELLDRIVVLLSLGPASALSMQPVSRRVSQVLQHVGANYRGPLALAMLASEFGMSVRSLAERVRAEIGVSLGKLVMQVRVKVAEHLLRSTSEKVETIATRCGFRSATHLSRALVKLTGLTPSDYRRAHH